MVSLLLGWERVKPAGLDTAEPLGLKLVGSGGLMYLARLLSIGQLYKHHHHLAFLQCVGRQGGTVSGAAVFKTSTR